MDKSTIPGEIAAKKSTDIPTHEQRRLKRKKHKNPNERKKLSERAGTVWAVTDPAPLGQQTSRPQRDWNPRSEKEIERMRKLHKKKSFWRTGVKHGKRPDGKSNVTTHGGFGERAKNEGEESEY